MDRKIRQQSGLTLIEVMVVVAIIGIAATIATTRFARISEAASISDDLHSIHIFLQSKKLAAFTEKQDIDIYIDSNGTKLIATIDPLGAKTNGGSISLKNSFGPNNKTFSINTRGLFSTTGNIRLLTQSNATADSCVSIGNTRLRLGSWCATSGKCNVR